MDRNEHLVIRDPNNREWFEYNGKRSDEFGIRIANELEFVSPQKDIEEVTVLGRDGVVLIDNERLNPIRKNIRLEIPVFDEMAKNDNGQLLHQLIMEIRDWLGVKGWHEWRFGMYPDYVWRATIKDTFNIADSMRSRGRGTIQVLFHPYMYLDYQAVIQLTQGYNLNNRTNEVAKPLIKVEGTGDISFKNNGEDWLLLRAVDQEIVVDSELMSVYRDNRPQYDKMIDIEPMFPLLYEGNNQITWTGNATKVTVEPRWVVKAT